MSFHIYIVSSHSQLRDMPSHDAFLVRQFGHGAWAETPMLSVAEKIQEIRMICWLPLSLGDLKVLMTETSAHLAKVANDETDSNHACRREFILVTLADVGLGHLKAMFANFVSASNTQWLFESVGENKRPIITRYAILFCEKLNETKMAKWFDQCNDD